MIVNGDVTIGLDRRGTFSFISHAHSDHSSFRKVNVVASKETAHLLGVDMVECDGCQLLPAGHMLGASQLWYEGDGFSVLYTGDFSLKRGYTYMPAQPKHADILVMESTYGDPQWLFDEGEWDRMLLWVREQLENGFSVIIGCNPLGKAQEIIARLNEEGILAVLSQRIKEHTKKYVELGYHLEWAAPSSSPFVALIERWKLNKEKVRDLSMAYHRRFKPAFATGLVKRFRFFGERFAISDHADFNQLLAYVDMVSPRLVLTTYGEKEKLAAELRKRGYTAAVYERPVNKWV